MHAMRQACGPATGQHSLPVCARCQAKVGSAAPHAVKMHPAVTNVSKHWSACPCRPASTDKVDDDAVVIGIPAGSFAVEAAPQREDSYFFVVLRAPQEVFRRQPPTPVKGLKLGPQLGAGEASSAHPMCPARITAGFATARVPCKDHEGASQHGMLPEAPCSGLLAMPSRDQRCCLPKAC